MHAAVFQLLKFHVKARIRRIAGAFSSPHRILLSLFVIALGCVWLGQAMMSTFMREPWEHEVFRRWVSLPLMGYFFWHVVRVAWKRPEHAIEWLPEEEGLIVGGPFTASQVLTYRVAVIFTATAPKALLTTLVLWPDLPWCGPPGLLLALVFIELFRLVMDLAANCLSDRGYMLYRAVIIGCVGLAVFEGYSHSRTLLAATEITESVPVPASQQAMAVVQSVRNGTVATVLESPFLMMADVISGHGTGLVLAGKLLVLLFVIGGMARLTLGLYQTWQRRSLVRERRLWNPADTGQAEVTSLNIVRSRSLPAIPVPGLPGPLVWRQCKRAWRYAGSLLISMAIPALLSCLPLFSIPNPSVAFVFVVCGVLFYTFVLLPEAIKFDFRLDSDHMCQLRALPLTSSQIVFAQLVTPVILASLFQIAVFVCAGLLRSVDPLAVVCASLISIPLTMIFVEIDNLVFLLYPHRPTQEGFEAFLRTILKFTGKSLLLTLAGGSLLLWAPAAAAISEASATLLSVPNVFYGGLCVGMTVVAVVLFRLLVRAYDRFDVSLQVT